VTATISQLCCKSRSAESGDGARFADHFTEDAICYDTFYAATGATPGREMIDPAFNRKIGRGWSWSSGPRRLRYSKINPS
jgi:hypothetical protein